MVADHLVVVPCAASGHQRDAPVAQAVRGDCAQRKRDGAEPVGCLVNRRFLNTRSRKTPVELHRISELLRVANYHDKRPSSEAHQI